MIVCKHLICNVIDLTWSGSCTGETGGGLAGGQKSPTSAAQQGDVGDDRGGKVDKTGKASGKTSNEDDSNTGAIGGTQTKKGKVGTGAPSDIGRG